MNQEQKEIIQKDLLKHHASAENVAKIMSMIEEHVCDGSVAISEMTIREMVSCCDESYDYPKLADTLRKANIRLIPVMKKHE